MELGKMLSLEEKPKIFSDTNCFADIKNLTDMEEIKSAYLDIQKLEEAHTAHLSDLFQGCACFDEKAKTLNKMIPNLELLETDSSNLCGIVQFTNDLAENISSKVRLLDLAKSQVFQAIQRVDDVLDLKFCTDGVKAAMESNDYEKAAANIYRYLCLDENVIKQSVHDATESSSINASLKVLKDARVEMSQVVSEQFDKAVSEGNLASVERFFKIFPLLKMEDEGLGKFSDYLCQEISRSSQENLKQALNMDPSNHRYNVMFADVLTLLFEGIARTVEKQQPLVETYYGPGKLFILIKQIQMQCDRQTKIILDEFKKVRKLTETAHMVQRSMYATGKKSEEAMKLDARNLEPLLSEVTVISSRTELYLRFLKRRVQADIDTVFSSEKIIEENKKELQSWITTCEVSHLIQEVIGYYIIMEEYYMRESIAKAIQLDNIEPGNLTSSMTDDVFFILKQCIKRSVTSDSIDCVCAMLNHTTSVLDADFKDVLSNQIKTGFPSGGMLDNISSAYNVMQSSFQQGKLQSVDEQNNATRQRFLCTLNNCEVASEHIQTLRKSLDAEVSKVFNQLSSQGQAKLESCLMDLGLLSSKFQSLLQTGLKELSTSLLKPEVKPWIANFLSVSHNLNEDDLANYEANDPWVQEVIYNLQMLINKFQVSLSTTIFDHLVSCLIDEIVVQLEKALFKSIFNRLGALFFDKELRSMVNYLTSITSWTVRDKFSRLMQMSTILNLEQVTEIEDYWGQHAGSLTWRLTPAEVRQVLTLRVDFKSEDIRKLKL
ncbi:conserved oligomeric Golgi complex subunit 4-like [Clavelina lepadiformis]|uniref:conserved oligomeric Golgi complex subunit 4-like n=1 Tax=Clavelina lepadiformis TaxID=159417 RepID=UPI0040417DAC